MSLNRNVKSLSGTVQNKGGPYFLAKEQSIDRLFYVLFLFINTPYYFFDPTIYLPKIIQLALSWILLLCIALRHRISWRACFILPFAYIFVLHVGKFTNIERYALIDILYVHNSVHVFFLLYLLNRDSDFIKKILDIYTKIFIILNLPSILFYLGILLNLNMDYSLIHLGGREHLYRNYYHLAIFNDYQILSLGSFTLTRLCGVFEEPGMLGTITAILIALNIILFPQKMKKRLTFLMIIGLLSLSMAFFVFMALLGVMIMLKKDLKRIVLISSIICMAILFLPPALKDAVDNLLLGRFMISEDGGLVGDTRRIEFAEKYKEYIEKAGYAELAFGHGAKSNQLDKEGQYSSYQGIVYESGYFGLAIIISFLSYFFLWLPLKYKRYGIIMVTIFPLLSIYQRPDPLMPHYLLAYAAVIASLPYRIMKKNTMKVVNTNA